MRFCCHRTTRETAVEVCLDDRPGDVKVDTGQALLDHLLESLSYTAGWSGTVLCRATVDPDGHHTYEDVGITLGRAVRHGIADANTARYGFAHVPMDDALAEVAIDVCGRPYFHFQLPSGLLEHGPGWNWDQVRELFAALARELASSLHITGVRATSGHHLAEAMAKATGLALAQAIDECDRRRSTKGAV